MMPAPHDTAPAERLRVPYTDFTLPNGLRVILHRDASVPTVAVNVWYHVGSGSEKPGRTGFAHLFEHLMFEGSKHVPEGAFDNPALVVQRFLPEREDGLYALRLYVFLGDREVSSRVLSHAPVVKSRDMIRRTDVPLHPGARAARERLGMDYGKIDYVVRDGEAVVFDANRTPAFSMGGETLARVASTLAPGLAAFAAR